MAFFVIFFFTVFTLGTVYLGWRLFSPLALSPLLLRSGWALLIFVILVTIGGLFAFRLQQRDLLPFKWLILWQEISYLLMGWLSFLAVFYVLWDLLRVPLWAGCKLWKIPLPAMDKWVTLIVVVLASACTALGMWLCFSPQLREQEAQVQGLPQDLNGLRIAVLTDLHLGSWLNGSFAKRVTEQIVAAKPDLIAIVGDIADGIPSYLDDYTEQLRQLRAPLGVFYVPGNHEYYWGVAEWIERMRSLGLSPIINDARVLVRGQTRFALLGITDEQAIYMDPKNRQDLDGALVKVPDNVAFKILLAHRPRIAPQAAAKGINLQLSGHTHGGQFFPWNLVIRLIEPFSRGFFQVEGMTLFVSRGTGTWGPPVRLGSSPEIPVLVLRSL